MRALFLCGLCLMMAACGGKKEQAKDPTDAPPADNDGTPKWEGATADDKAGQPAGTSTAAKPSSTAPQEATARRTDQYDKDATESVLKRAARQVKGNCGQAKDENGKAIGPWGKLTVQVTLGANGRSKGIQVPSPWQGKPVGTCIERSFSNLQFPPWNGSDTTVPWDVELIEPGKEAKQ